MDYSEKYSESILFREIILKLVNESKEMGSDYVLESGGIKITLDDYSKMKFNIENKRLKINMSTR